METIQEISLGIARHPLFAQIKTLEQLRFFMECHVFAVWDFMSLLKRLQRDITCIQLPWYSSSYNDQMVRFINEIVLAEESDELPDGSVLSHFSLYLKAMEEIGADTSLIKSYLASQDDKYLHPVASDFVKKNLQVAQSGSLFQVACYFFYGREKLIPDMFEQIISVLEKEDLKAPLLSHYLARHIEIDGEEHGPMAEKLLQEINHSKNEDPRIYALESLMARKSLWDKVLEGLAR